MVVALPRVDGGAPMCPVAILAVRKGSTLGGARGAALCAVEVTVAVIRVSSPTLTRVLVPGTVCTQQANSVLNIQRYCDSE